MARWHAQRQDSPLSPYPSVCPSVGKKGKLEKHPRFNLSQLHLSFTSNVFFSLPITKFYLINCIHFIHFVLVPCVYLLNGGGHWTGDGQLAQGKRTGGVKPNNVLCSTILPVFNILGLKCFQWHKKNCSQWQYGWNIGVLSWYQSFCCSFLNLLWTKIDPHFTLFYLGRESPIQPFVLHAQCFSSKTIGDEHTSSSLESIKVMISAVIIIGLFLFRAETVYEGRMPMSKYMQERYLSQKCIFLLSRTTRG